MERGWCVAEDAFDSAGVGHAETLYALSNGYLGVRAAPEEGRPAVAPATFIAGVFDAAPGAVPELVVAPDWLSLRVFVGGEEFAVDLGEILEYRRVLNMRDGVLEREVRWKDGRGRVTRLAWRRIVSMADVRVAAVHLLIAPENHDAEIVVMAAIDGDVSNASAAHLDVVDRGWREAAGAAQAGQGQAYGPWYLATRTRNSSAIIAEAAAIAVRGAREVAVCGRVPEDGWPGRTWGMTASPDSVAGISLKLRCAPGTPVVIDKYAGFGTSLDERPSGPGCGLERVPRTGVERAVNTAVAAARRGAACGFERLLEDHRRIWHDLWDRCDIVIEGDPAAQQAVRFAIFQMAQAAPRHTDRVSIGARGLSGEGYRGHVFWDTETFVVPFFTYTLPEIARRLLGYRYRTLGAARANAASRGYRGAMYAWESTDTGAETTPAWSDPHPDTGKRRRILCGDLEHHITADVAYAVWQYYLAAGDEEFLLEQGAEILLETGRFWASRASRDRSDGAYEIRHVIGPDEYHEDVDNNFFTNLMARWNMRTALAVSDYLASRHPSRWAEIAGRIGLGRGELASMAEVAEGLLCGRLLDDPTRRASGQAHLPGPTPGLILEQFDGFRDLADVDLSACDSVCDSACDRRARSMESLSGVDIVRSCKAVKQPDVLMALHLMPEEAFFQARKLAGEASRADEEPVPWRLEDFLLVNWDYYEPRCDHGSSLSFAIHSALASRLGLGAEAYDYFVRASEIDLEDAMGNTANGIHMATQGGIWQAVVMGFAGIRPAAASGCAPGGAPGVARSAAAAAASAAAPGAAGGFPARGLLVDPGFPERWRRVSIPVCWRGRRIRFEFSRIERETRYVEEVR